MGKPKFDPKKPFEVVDETATPDPNKPKFDPKKPFEVISSAPTEAPEHSFLEGVTEAGIEGLPMIGATIGGLAAGGTTFGTGTLPGAAFGGMTGLQLQKLVRAYQRGELKDYVTGAPSLAGTVEATKENIVAGAQGMGQEAGGALVGQGLVKAGQAFAPIAKKGLEGTMAAAQRLGFKPTPAMVEGSPVVQGLESTLEQAPTISGWWARRQTEPAKKAIQESMQGTFGEMGKLSKFQTGEKIAEGVTGQLGEKYGAVQMAYEPFNLELPKMRPAKEAVGELASSVESAVKRNLSLSFNVKGLAKEVSDGLFDARNLDDIENLRKQVSSELTQAYKAKDTNAIDGITKIQDKLADFVDDQFVTLAKEAMPVGGAKVGKDMVAEYAATKQMYSQLRKDMEPLGQLLGIKNTNPKGFIEALQNIPEEQIVAKLSNTKNLRSLRALQEYLPEQFELIRQSKLKEIYEKSINDKGSLVVEKFANFTKKMEPEIKELIFGNKTPTVQDLEIVSNALPNFMGKSGTPQGNAFTWTANPFQEAQSALNYTAYKAIPKVGGALTAAGQAAPAASTGIGMIEKSIADSFHTADNTPPIVQKFVTRSLVGQVPETKDGTNQVLQQPQAQQLAGDIAKKINNGEALEVPSSARKDVMVDLHDDKDLSNIQKAKAITDMNKNGKFVYPTKQPVPTPPPTPNPAFKPQAPSRPLRDVTDFVNSKRQRAY